METSHTRAGNYCGVRWPEPHRFRFGRNVRQAGGWGVGVGGGGWGGGKLPGGTEGRCPAHLAEAGGGQTRPGLPMRHVRGAYVAFSGWS